MLRAKNIFDLGLVRVRNIDSIYLHLTQKLGFNSSDISDILRSEIVYSVSSFDRLIHDLVKIGMIETFKGQRVATNAFNNFNISLAQFDVINNASIPPPEFVFGQSITSNHKHLSFQEPEKVSEALSLIWNENHKWQKIATSMGKNQNDVKTELKNIVIRRNQIVHEGDFDLSTGNLQVIEHFDTLQTVDFIEDLATSIYNLVK